MSQNELLDQKLAGILSALDSAPASQLHQPISQQYAVNYNNARNSVIAANPDLTELCPPAIEINPDASVEASYLEVKTYVGELHTFIQNKIYAERAARRRANPPRVIREDFSH
jgi:hypothetical protein